MPLRLRLGLWYGTLSALIVTLLALLGYGAYVRGQYQTLDQVLLLSASHVEAGWRTAGISYVLEANTSQLEVTFRLYGADGSLKRTSRQVPPLPELNPIAALEQPGPKPLDRLRRLLPRLEPALQIPEASSFDIAEQGGKRWRYVVTHLMRGEETLGYLQTITPLSNLDRAVSQLGCWLLLLGVVSVLGMFGLSLALAQVVLRPVSQLTQAASEIAHSHDLSRRVTGGASHDELGLLGNTFNAMLGSLDQAAQNQKRFVADASHELRAPLTAIQGNLELLYRYPQMPDHEREESILKANREVARLSRLVSDLLTLAKSDAGLPVRQIPLELKGIVQEAMREAVHLLQGQRLEAFHLEETHLKGDPDHLKQLVLILLDNAIKYTPSAGTVRVELRHQANQAVLKFSDSGFGIAEAELPKVFERFYRADKARTRNKGGTGLGLSIAQWIVERHGGSVVLESQAGLGTTATVRLHLSGP